MAAKEVTPAKELTKLKVVGPAIPEPPPELFTQRKRVDVGRYRLLVDRQLKRSYEKSEDAEAKGLSIKQAHPIVQVVVYDSVEGINQAIELPKA
jgi:hypothetical protein